MQFKPPSQTQRKSQIQLQRPPEVDTTFSEKADKKDNRGEAENLLKYCIKKAEEN